MSISVEILEEEIISICHYGIQNDDSMRDPEMIFKREKDSWIPTYYRNDYIGIEEIEPTEKSQKKLAVFANQWMLNIKYQQKL